MRFRALLTAPLAAALVLAPAPLAAAQTEPFECAPRNPPSGYTGLDAWTTHAELGAELQRLAAERPDTVAVEQVGETNRGRALWSARIGTGDRVVLVTSEIHGNEKTGTEALLTLLDELSGPGAAAAATREAITFVAIPKMNADGAELDRRVNDRTWDEVVADFPQLAGAPPSWNYRDTGSVAARPGFDVNRDYHPDLDYVPAAEDLPGSSPEPGWYIQPESQAVRDVYKGLLAEFGRVDAYVDLHHQGPCYAVGDTNEPVTMSISGRFVPDPATPEGAQWAEYADRYDYDLSRQLNVAAYQALTAGGRRNPFDAITLYPQDTDLPGTGLGAFALNGSGVVLFEVRGQTQNWGIRQRGVLIQTVERGLRAIVDGVATGSVYDLDPERYESIPETNRDPG